MECYVKIKSVLSQNEQLTFQDAVQTRACSVQLTDFWKEIALFCNRAD